MTAVSHKRGHEIVWADGQWCYADTGEAADYERPCVRCGQMPTIEGYDACLGFIPQVESACCGHGVELPYLTG